MKNFFFPILLLLQLCVSAQTVNEKIISFVDQNLNKKVGTGQCWDLASAALNYANAKWESPYEFGTKINSSQTIMPGDIIRFKNVKWKHDNYRGAYPEHTAIIYKVKKKGEYQIAEQNNNGKLYVIISDFHIAWKTSGTVEIYRPK